MSYGEIRSALVNGFTAALGTPLPPVEYENLDFVVPEDCKLWLSVAFVVADTTPVTLGDDGWDEVRGFLQVDINVPKGDGEVVVFQNVSTLRNYFKGGKGLTYKESAVVIVSSSPSPARIVGNWYRVSLTINFYSRIKR